MNNLLTIQDLFRHMEWADAKVWAAVLNSDEAVNNAPLRDRLKHIHGVQRAFLKIWNGETPQSPVFSDSISLLRWALEYYPEVAGYLDSITNADLERPVVIPWSKMLETRFGRKAEASTLYETMLQVAMHSTYHRGQVNTKLRELGGEPPLTDFIAWVWLGKPHPDWPTETA